MRKKATLIKALAAFMRPALRVGTGALTLCAAMSVATAIAAKTQPKTGHEGEYRAALQRLDSAMALIGRAEHTIDRGQFEPVSLVGQLDADPTRIAAFVRSHIAFQPYPGALRGVKGTLMARAGNALDQSLLLAALLHDAGYDARVDYAPLNDAQAQRVFEQITRARAPAPAPVDARALAALLKTAPGAKDPALVKRLKQATQQVHDGPPATEMATWLAKVLAKSGIKIDAGNMSARLFESAHDYFWVEYRSDPWAKWQAVQPVFADAAHDLSGIGAKERYYGAIPERWQWRLHLELVMETKQGDALDASHLLDWTRPVANLAGRPLGISVAPTNLSSRAALKNLKKTFAQAKLFSARFNGSQIDPLFDDSGNMVDPVALSGQGFGAADVFMTMNKKEQAAAGALAALGGGSDNGRNPHLPIQVLTGLWIDVSVIPPEGYGAPRHQRRFILDRIGNRQRRAGKVTHLTPMKPADIARRLTASYTFVASGGQPADGVLMRRMLQRISRQRSFFVYAAKLIYLGRDDGVTLADYLMSLSLPSLPQLGLLRDAAAATPAGTYRPAPAVVAVETGRAPDYAAQVRMDVIFDPAVRPVLAPHTTDAPGDASHGADMTAMGTSHSDPAPSLVAGVRTTRLETGRLGSASAGTRRTSAYALLSAAHKSNATFHVLVPAEDDAGRKQNMAALATFKLPAASADAIVRDLDAGYAVVLPERKTDGETHVAWWRVAPQTGETLGMMDDGRGGDLAEEVDLLQVALNGTLDAVSDIYGTEGALKGVWGCIDSPDPSCCVAGVAGSFAFGKGQGKYLSGMGKALNAELVSKVIGGVLSFLPGPVQASCNK